jgi:hypothetical protein
MIVTAAKPTAPKTDQRDGRLLCAVFPKPTRFVEKILFFDAQLIVVGRYH